jgi:V8-like Glu-specific endopeptidase
MWKILQMDKDRSARNLILRLTLVLVFALTFSRSAEIDAQEVNAKMVGGSFEPSAAGYKVAYISTPDYFCSGALVGTRAILTAAHCVVGGPSASEFAVYVGRDWYQVESTWYHPKYDQNQTPYQSAKYDLGMIILSKSVTSTKPLSILSGRPLRRGARLLIAGYGTNERSNDPSRSFIDNFKVGVANVVKVDGRQIFSSYRSNGASTCAGDSGGPASVSYGRSSIALAGIVSAGINTVTNDNRCELREDGSSIYVDLQSSASRAFLRAFKGLKYVR